jgi:hypothetical protein
LDVVGQGQTLVDVDVIPEKAVSSPNLQRRHPQPYSLARESRQNLNTDGKQACSSAAASYSSAISHMAVGKDWKFVRLWRITLVLDLRPLRTFSQQLGSGIEICSIGLTWQS